MRKPIIAGNWKMYKTAGEAVKLVQDLEPLVEGVGDVDIVVCPPFTALHSIQTVLEYDKPGIALGAQDVHWEEEGAYTGEVSPGMLVDVGAAYCIVGHSERREYFGETDESVNKKVKALIAHGIKPIMCCGESLEQREAGQTQAFVSSQVRGGLDGLTDEQMAGVVIAYEPIWAIGTGKTSSSEDANDVARNIRAVVGSMFRPDVARDIRIQYGGSVKPENTALFLAEPDIDGALVGGASLTPESFAGIVKNAG